MLNRILGQPISDISEIWQGRFEGAVVLSTEKKYMKNDLDVLEREEKIATKWYTKLCN